MQEIFIVGPTGAGKSEYAKRLFSFIVSSQPWAKVALINVDSISFYKYFDIASAKPSKEDIDEYNYYGVNIAKASQPINVYVFYQYYQQLKEKYKNDYTHFILVGGSGLYIDSIYYNYSFSNQFDMQYDYSADINLYSNQRRKDDIAHRGWHHNVDRINSTEPQPIIGLWHSRLKDEQFIIKRFEYMLESGAMYEVERLINRYGANNSILKAVNYSSMTRFMLEHKSKEWLMDDIVKQNKKLVKKQRTWFNKNQNIYWIENSSYDDTQNEYLWSSII